MIADPESVASKLRWIPGIKDVDIVHFPTGKELWVVLRDPINLGKLRKASESRTYRVVRRGGLISKLPRSLAEMVWDGVMYVVTKDPDGSKSIKSADSPAMAARIMRDFATGETVYHINEAEGLEILQEYLRS